MNQTINKDLIQFYCDNLAETLIQKNHDYGNSVQEQFQEYGLASILMRLDDKMRRLKTLRTLTPQVREESLKDTLKDLSGYALLGLMCLVLEEQEKVKIGQLKVPKKFLAPLRTTEDWMKLEDVKQQLKPKKPPYFDPDDQH